MTLLLLLLLLSQVWFIMAYPQILAQGLYCLTQRSNFPPALSAFTCRMRRLMGCSESLPFASTVYTSRTKGSSPRSWQARRGHAHREWPRGVVLKEVNHLHNLYKCRILQIVTQNIFWHLRIFYIIRIAAWLFQMLKLRPLFWSSVLKHFMLMFLKLFSFILLICLACMEWGSSWFWGCAFLIQGCL